MNLTTSIMDILGSWRNYEKSLSKKNITMTTTTEDLVGKIWTVGRPAEPNSPINALPLKFAGTHVLFTCTSIQSNTIRCKIRSNTSYNLYSELCVTDKGI